MIVSIHQPDYIPYLGFFYKVSKSEVFVFLDDAQFSNDNMHNWNRIKTANGECRLKIPVEQHLGDKINTVRTRDELRWKEKHIKTIEMNYKKAQYYKEIFPVFCDILLNDYLNLAELNVAINTWIIDGFGFKAKIMKSSDMKINTLKEERVIDIVNYINGTVYLSGNGAKAYQIDEHFENKGIQLVYSNYKPIEYVQLWDKKGFMPYLSVMDYLLNYGFNWKYIEDKLCIL